jgi:hypothetical protein
LVHAVVATLVELSVFVKMVELMIGCDVKVAIPFTVVAPLNVVAPLKVVVEVAVPKVIEPVVKLDPIVIAEVIEEALITLTVAVEIFKAETLIEDRVCVPDHV